MNTSPVVLFDFEDHYVRTITDEQGYPWFVAADVCAILGIQSVTNAVRPLDEDERGLKSIGRQGETNVVSESGLYTLIIRSNKPEAKKFRKWVTAEVLPAIRKTGTYTRPNVPIPIVAESDWPLALAQTREGERMARELVTGLKIAKLIGRKNRRQMLEQANGIVMKRTGIDCLAYFGIDLNEIYQPLAGAGEMIERFIADCCVVDEKARTKAAVLYGAFLEWYHETIDGGTPPSVKVFSDTVKPRFRKIKSECTWYCGLRLSEKEVAR